MAYAAPPMTNAVRLLPSQAPVAPRRNREDSPCTWPSESTLKRRPASEGNSLGYFDHLASSSFTTNAEGERLFLPNGPWSRPYLVPDDATQRRLHRKQKRLYQVSFCLVLVSLPFLDGLDLYDRPLWFVIFLVVAVALVTFAGKLLLASDLKPLRRVQGRLSVREFVHHTARRHSKAILVLGTVASLLFVAGGIWMLYAGVSAVTSVFVIVFFSLTAVMWGSALVFKLTT